LDSIGYFHGIANLLTPSERSIEAGSFIVLGMLPIVVAVIERSRAASILARPRQPAQTTEPQSGLVKLMIPVANCGEPAG
jgi:hypothetical protein